MLDDPGLIAEFVAESKEHLQDVEEHLLQIEQDGAAVDSEVVNHVFRAVHSIKGAAGFLGLLRLQDLSHSMENVLNLIREGKLTPTKESIEILLRSVDMLNQMLDDIENSNKVEVSFFVERLESVAGSSQSTSDSPAPKPAEAQPSTPPAANDPTPLTDFEPPLGLGAQPPAGPFADVIQSVLSPETSALETSPASLGEEQKAKKKKDNQDASIRVQVEVLDQLMNLAGELVLGRNQLLQAVGSRDYTSLESVTTRLDQVTSELQDSIMQTRMQPIGSVFNKFMRLSRDVSDQLGKKCELELEGQEVEVDKTISEAIGDPLTHLVRNAIDHGIEPPSHRLSMGKPEFGRLKLRAYHQSGKVRIEISDDGKGVSADSLRERAVANGVLTAEAASQLSDAEAVRLMFHPGVSTAAKVTEVSGRGVGMDVVRSNIEKLGGSVDIKSDPGVGTTILLTLPLTLAIIPSMVVGCVDQRFAIPQVNTAELVRIRANEIATRIEKVKGAEMLRLRGALLPLIRLSETLDITSATDTDNDSLHGSTQPHAINVVVVEAGSLRYGLIVDAMYDSEEIVVKPLGRHVKNCPCLSGATILGDGRVALILDISGIAGQAELQNRQEESTTSSETEVESSSTEQQTVLLFTNHPDERFAAPMHLVARIERIAAEDISEIGDERLLHYRGGSLPLLSLEDHIQARPRDDHDRLFAIVFEASGHEVALLASSLVDIRNVSADFDPMISSEPGVAGTQVIDGTPTRAIDLFEFARAARPDWFQSPVPPSQAPERPAPESLQSPPETEKPTILLAEDSAFFRRQLVGFLKTEGYQIIECEDGEIAWRKLLSTPSVGLVLTDIEMPNLNGLELSERIRGDEATRHLPIIALTSLAGQEDEDRGYEAGIDEYQVKLDRENLLRSVNRLTLNSVREEVLV